MHKKPNSRHHNVQQNFSTYWGIEITSSKIEGVILDGEDPLKALYRVRFTVEPFHAFGSLRGYDHIINQVQLLVAELERISGMIRPAKIGVATAGVAHPVTGILGTANTLCLNGHTVQADLSFALNVQVLLANDVNCFTLGEAHLGAGRGHNVVLGITMETGIGGGIVVGGQLLQGLHGIAGEWGHNKLRGSKALCHCGKRGCNEIVFAEPALERFYEKITGEELSLSEIVHRADQGEEEACQTMARLQEKFAEAVAVSINHLDPDVIVMGGRVGTIDLLHTEETRGKIAPYIFNKEFKTPLFKPALGDSAGPFGAALLSGLD